MFYKHRRPRCSTRTYTLFPDPPCFRSRLLENGAVLRFRRAAVGERAPLQARHQFVVELTDKQIGHRVISYDINAWPIKLSADREHGEQAERADADREQPGVGRSEEHTSELQSLMRISYAVFCLKKKKTQHKKSAHTHRKAHSK